VLVPVLLDLPSFAVALSLAPPLFVLVLIAIYSWMRSLPVAYAGGSCQLLYLCLVTGCDKLPAYVQLPAASVASALWLLPVTGVMPQMISQCVFSAASVRIAYASVPW
jgi:hypothetical protein